MITLGVILAAVLTFNVTPPGRLDCCTWIEVPGPVIIDGWRFTSTFNAWVTPDPVTVEKSNGLYHDSPWLGFTGNSPATFTVTSDRGMFTLSGFDSIGLQTASGRLVGSGGQVLDYFTERYLAHHYEVSWSNLEWIRFEHDIDAGYGPNGIDNLQVSTVDEPGTGWLIGFAGLMLFGFSRKMKWQ